MKVSIRKSKYQKLKMTIRQLQFANESVVRYLRDDNQTYFTYTGHVGSLDVGCDIYRTKTQISAVVYFK